ncbi:MAG: hypothetical protein CL814_10265 [Confluentimicrobium sp.]|uniref:energy transducer TonB n=1 Tax=Actibacterium sp. TaxID=1872125 RepID=UPI000C5328C6|nr:energy transducer TonB [Actibacterium sp.]MBC57307.1 hypothetical protein [Actibacterium sp.]
MRRIAEIALFLPVAAALHLAGFGLAGGARTGSEAGAQGAGGENLLTLAAAPPQISALVAAWDSPPEVSAAPAAVQPPPAAIAALPPVMPAPASDPPDRTGVAARPSLPTPDPEPDIRTVETAPQPRPEAPKKPAPPPEAPAKRAAGTGGGAQAGEAGASANPGQQRALASSWAGQIQARVARVHRMPAAALRLGLYGDVTVRITVARDGRLQSARVVKSAGLAVLDQAALQSVRRAGRFPPAPEGLTRPAMSFDVPLAFERD